MPKRKITLWVDEVVADKVETIAKVEKLTVSQIGARLLERGVTDYADGMAWDVLGDRVETVLRKEIGRMSDRLSNLVIRGAIESSAIRRLLFADLVTKHGRVQADSMRQFTYADALTALKKPIEGWSDPIPSEE